MSTPPQPKELGLLIVVILKGQHLPDPHKFSKQDPFVVCSLSSNPDKEYKTRVDKGGGQHPVWDDEFRLRVFEPQEGEKSILNLKVMREERKDDVELIGEANILADGSWKEFDEWVELKENGKYRGELYLECTFYPVELAKPRPRISDIQRRPSKLDHSSRMSRNPAAPPTSFMQAAMSKLSLQEQQGLSTIKADLPPPLPPKAQHLRAKQPASSAALLPFPGDPDPPALPESLKPGQRPGPVQPPTTEPLPSERLYQQQQQYEQQQSNIGMAEHLPYPGALQQGGREQSLRTSPSAGIFPPQLYPHHSSPDAAPLQSPTPSIHVQPYPASAQPYHTSYAAPTGLTGPAYGPSSPARSTTSHLPYSGANQSLPSPMPHPFSPSSPSAIQQHPQSMQQSQYQHATHPATSPQLAHLPSPRPASFYGSPSGSYPSHVTTPTTSQRPYPSPPVCSTSPTSPLAMPGGLPGGFRAEMSPPVPPRSPISSPPPAIPPCPTQRHSSSSALPPARPSPMSPPPRPETSRPLPINPAGDARPSRSPAPSAVAQKHLEATAEASRPGGAPGPPAYSPPVPPRPPTRAEGSGSSFSSLQEQEQEHRQKDEREEREARVRAHQEEEEWRIQEMRREAEDRWRRAEDERLEREKAETERRRTEEAERKRRDEEEDARRRRVQQEIEKERLERIQAEQRERADRLRQEQEDSRLAAQLAAEAEENERRKEAARREAERRADEELARKLAEEDRLESERAQRERERQDEEYARRFREEESRREAVERREREQADEEFVQRMRDEEEDQRQRRMVEDERLARQLAEQEADRSGGRQG
ncbi:hypothetical protein JCM11641_003572 [Rhodosporidiobolus odoratus]